MSLSAENAEEYEPVPEEEYYTPKTEEHERFGAKVREILGKRLDETGIFTEVKDIEYETKEGRRVSLKELLPDGWEILREARDALGADINKKVIMYGDHYNSSTMYVVPEDLPLPEEVKGNHLIRRILPEERKVFEVREQPQIARNGFFLFLLHEFGHAHAHERMSPEEQKTLAMLRLKLKFRASEHGAMFSSEERKQWELHIIKNERDAWAWALRILKRLRAQGIDLEPKLKLRKDILHAVHTILATYEAIESYSVDPKAYTGALRGLDQLLKEYE